MAQPSTCVPGYEVGALARLGVTDFSCDKNQHGRLVRARGFVETILKQSRFCRNNIETIFP